MRKQIIWIIAAILTTVLCKCSSESADNANYTPAYNDHVAAYTSGIVSRKSNVYVILSKDMAQETQNSLKPEKVIKITPKTEGKYSITDSHTIVFTPSKEMERNTVYSVEVDIPAIFNEGEPFSFCYTTKPFAVNGCLSSFDVTDDDRYELTFALNTADIEDAATVEKNIVLTADCQKEWSHSADGKTHKLKTIVSGGKARTLEVKTEANKSIDLTENTIVSTEIPSSETLTVFEAKYKSGDSKYIEITFNKNLDSKQNKKGLAYIIGNISDAVDAEGGNKLKLYPDDQREGVVSIFLAQAIRSKSGQTLDKDITLNVTVETIKPAIRFVGDGTIIPQSDKIVIPFQSVYMKGVKVKVFKIFNNMVGRMLQNGNIDAYDQLKYAGRPIAATTFYMDEYGYDLSEWHTYAVDLTDQIKMDPGSMYRIEMSLDPRLSAWECDTLPKATKEEMAAEDKLVLTEMCNEFDNGGWYYTGQTYEKGEYAWWLENFYELKENPSSHYYYQDKAIGKNVLATNIGLTAFKGTDNTLKVVALDLPNAEPIDGVSIEAYSMQQQLIGKGNTDSEGQADIELDEKLGQPLYIVAKIGSDVSYLRIKRGEELSTSSFDVAGEIVQKGLKGYIYGDRGVWRPGDTLHIAFMLNDKNKTLPEDHPVTLQINNPIGQTYQRITRTNGAMGLYTFNVPIAADALTGSWTAEIAVGGVTFTKSLRIETIKPNRLKIDLKMPSVLDNGNNQAKLHTEWLNGGIAKGLKYDITATIVEAKTGWNNLKGYCFDNITKTFETQEQEVARGEVGTTGNATIGISTHIGNTAPGMLKCNIVTHVYEPSGEFSTDALQTMLSPYARYVGLKSPQTADKSFLETDKDQKFEVISVDKDGQAVGDVNMQVKIYKVEWYWWWRSSKDEMAGYTTSRYNTPVRTLRVQTDKNGKGSFTLNIGENDWGTYLIEAKDLNGEHSTAILSYFDWPWMTSRRSMDGRESATVLSITTDKKEYALGEKMHISIPSTIRNRALVSVSNGSKILVFKEQLCTSSNTDIVVDVTEEMLPNVYVSVALVQPYGQSSNDMPIRLYGVVPVSVTSAKSHLTPVINCNDEIRPEAKCTVSVSETDGREMAYTLAIVDEGLLDLTHFKTPNAWNSFNAREAMGIRMWDLYGHVNGAYGGRIEQMFSIGGDEALNNGPKAIVNRFTPMVHFEGPFVLKKGKKNNHTINVPNYNGRVRVMVVAGDGEAYGCAEKSVLVRRPLMIIGTMPRQIGVGDEMTVSATIFASKKLGKIKAEIKAEGDIEVVGDKTNELNFDEAGDKTVQFRVKAGSQSGTGTISLVASNNEDKVDYTANIDIRSVSQAVSKTTSTKIDGGKKWNDKVAIPGDGDYKIAMELSAIKPLNMNGRLSSLIGYPHGCVEQTTSKIFPQLYLADYATLSEAQQTNVENNIKAGIEKLRTYQTTDGGMAYWPGSNYSNVWASAYVLHFFTEASARGYYIPEDMHKKLQNYVTGKAKNWRSTDNYYDEIADASYSLYVLAKAQATELGAMNRMKEIAPKLQAAELYTLAAAYSLAGRSDIAREIMGMEANAQRSTYWYDADVMKLIAETSCGDNNAATTAERVRNRLMSDKWMSTSETSHSLLAMTMFFKKNNASEGLKFKASINGKEAGNAKDSKYVWSHEEPLAAKTAEVAISNSSNAELYAEITATGIATQSAIEKTSNGLEVTARYANNDGTPINVDNIEQSATFKAYISVRNTSGSKQEHIAVTHILPAGWEILSADANNNCDYYDIRDDRMLTYKDVMQSGETITIIVNISATYAGHYYMPSIHAEAMYNASVAGCTESSECTIK